MTPNSVNNAYGSALRSLALWVPLHPRQDQRSGWEIAASRLRQELPRSLLVMTPPMNP